MVSKQGQMSMDTAIKRLDLVLKVKYSKILIFKAIFLCRKSAKSLQKKISLKNTKMGDKLLLIPHFDNFDFQCTLGCQIDKYTRLFGTQET